MIFRHRETKKPVLWTTAYDPEWKNIDSPNLIRVRCAEDLPFTEDVAHIYRQMNIPEVVWELQGRFGFYTYLSAFFMDDWSQAKRNGASWWKLKKLYKQGKKDEKDFWFLLLPEGFPEDAKDIHL